MVGGWLSVFGCCFVLCDLSLNHLMQTSWLLSCFGMSNNRQLVPPLAPAGTSAYFPTCNDCLQQIRMLAHNADCFYLTIKLTCCWPYSGTWFHLLWSSQKSGSRATFKKPICQTIWADQCVVSKSDSLITGYDWMWLKKNTKKSSSLTLTFPIFA